MVVESLCSWSRVTANSRIAWRTSERTKAGSSLRNKAAKARPTPSSLRPSSCWDVRPNRSGAYPAAHSPMPYSGSRETSRLRSRTTRALAAGTFTRLSSRGRCSRRNSSRRSRWRTWLRMGRAPALTERRQRRPAWASLPGRRRLRRRPRAGCFRLGIAGCFRLRIAGSPCRVKGRFQSRVRAAAGNRRRVVRAGMKCPPRGKIKTRVLVLTHLRQILGA